MSRLQPSLREAEEQAAAVERTLEEAVESSPATWFIYKPPQGEERVESDGFWVRLKRMRYGYYVRWPMSDISARCRDCGGVLRASRDAGGQGFYYDHRWLAGNPAAADPRTKLSYIGHFVCLPCFNRARPKIAAAQRINEIRLMIGRIKREARHAA
jgi:hypothetical protein